jgi:hypothetical protein
MIYDKIEPLTPIKDPIVVRSGLSNMKPGEWVKFRVNTQLMEITLSYKSKTAGYDCVIKGSKKVHNTNE